MFALWVCEEQELVCVYVWKDTFEDSVWKDMLRYVWNDTFQKIFSTNPHILT